MFRNLPSILLLDYLIVSTTKTGDTNIDMSAIRALAKKTVDEILEGAPVSIIETERYWEAIRDRDRPMIVFFYSNINGPSQRLATLVLFIAKEYSDRIYFSRVKVAEKGLPDKNVAKRLKERFSLDDTPGILFYDNVKDKMVLEGEDYIEADFKEFRSPQIFLWKTYYSTVRKELDKLLSD
jgi:hypothetical protein